ncbi:hypothetical protein ARALYDRAFT_899603 [Arabidopsis lyrata subsp. lyrata]|uniref:GLTSCR protein conserved domain-containing protein n=2 Tax=Arabidopsis lyrata subsp. lyrata TaxID=81972 RepID=D7L055_ARALL|nr:hypothetical protein ARALYDRAFT_899603 [Arabidopsis lyrata subsp. lyrata]
MRPSNQLEIQFAYQDAWRVCHPDFKRPFASLEDACESLLGKYICCWSTAKEVTCLCISKDMELSLKLMEMKQRLGKIEEPIKEIVLETNKPSRKAPTKTQEDQSTKFSPKEESKPEKEYKGNVQKPADGLH